ncbi:uncharacterized protein A1O5_07228 [Cladophialophora psammophila CBS 110553]|uniref:Uncharacterized protein n=1 Tax=Cladophialophora psammophila CBS 110553 TaxID=1182543 RepID=W9WLY3_9EURO|nr:uncharacterized protein A1O5_07228 [Cladophialophora psammophila CBS 110553]EXJ69192.1 hypothetical protein A1O5_07228 [Cladophialophora psammophila CBS 110553]
MSPNHAIRPGHDVGPAANVNPVSRITWRLIVCHLGAYYLHEVSLLSTDRGPDIMAKLLEEYKHSESWLAHFVPFMFPMVYAAALAAVPIENLTTTLPCLVDVDAFNYSHVLTSALRQRQTRTTLPLTPSFITSYGHFAVLPEAPNNTVSRDAILIKLELNNLALLVFLTLAFLMSVAAGVSAGLIRQSLDTGFGVFGAVAGVVGLVEGYATWKLK